MKLWVVTIYESGDYKSFRMKAKSITDLPDKINDCDVVAAFTLDYKEDTTENKED